MWLSNEQVQFNPKMTVNDYGYDGDDGNDDDDDDDCDYDDGDACE